MRVEVKQDPDGIWYCRPYIGTDALGRQIRPYRRFPDARDGEEAQRLAETWAANLTADGRVRSARLVDLLVDYIDMRGRNGASPNSLRSYRLFALNYVRRYIGTRNARDLTVMDFNRFEQRLLSPKAEGGQGLCRNSVIDVHNFLRGAYRHFVAAGICDSNPLVNVSKPSPERREAHALDEWDFAAVERALRSEMAAPRDARASAMAFAAWLVLRTGLRCGEVCALHRREIVRSGPHVHVGGTVIEERGRAAYRRDVTKGKKCRNVSITAGDLAVVEAYLARQAPEVGGMGPGSPVVTADGSYMRPSSVSAAFSDLRDRLGIDRGLTFHGLRHTHATWWLAHGGDLKSLSERLGHADEATTLRLYAHVLPGRDAEMARVVSGAMESAAETVSKDWQPPSPA